MSKLRIMIEPGMNWSKKSPRTTNGVYEYEFYTDVVYKIMAIFKGDPNVEILDPTWARKNPSMNERIEYINGTENMFDCLISLRFKKHDVDGIIIETNDAGIRLGNKVAKTFSNAGFSINIGEIDNRKNIINRTTVPAFIISKYCRISEGLDTQASRWLYAHQIAFAICDMYGIPRIKESPTVVSPDMLGMTLVDDVSVRSTYQAISPVISVLPKDSLVQLCGYTSDDKYAIICYGQMFGYVDADVIKVIMRYDTYAINTENKASLTCGDHSVGTVTSFRAPIINLNTGKKIGVVYKNTKFEVCGEFNDHFIIGGVADNLKYTFVGVPKKCVHITEPTCVDTESLGNVITRQELHRRGYTNILL